ncbi:MAG TPA: PA14 domain-containing protein, partial [Methanocella sp.]|nr:PA14 domain-containing protein [Methanocella sp.]
DDGSYLTVDGAQVIDNGGLHSPAEKQGTVHLTPGYHDIETKMYEHTGLAVARLEYSSPTVTRRYVQDVCSA